MIGRRKPEASASVELDPGEWLSARSVALPDGRRLRAVTGGPGSGPLVVFEAGMSAPAAEWVHTQRAVSQEYRTLAYDRAGYGGSDPDPAPRSLTRIVDDLTGLLDAVEGREPVILVGHSWGGPIIRLFADRSPERVAGLVLVDATVAESISSRLAPIQALSFRVMGLAAAVGRNGLIKRVGLPDGPSPDISQRDMDIFWRDYACTTAMRAAGQEVAHIASSKDLVQELEHRGVPGVPTVCIQGGREFPGASKLRARVNEISRDLMSAAANGRTVVVAESGHLVPQEHPAPVIRTILEVAREVHASTPVVE